MSIFERSRPYTYIIVGGGTAGCVLANRLSADPKNEVLLIEGGGSGRGFYVDMPLGVAYMLGRPRFDWCYKSEPEPYLNGRSLALPRGKMLGGSSSINGLIYVRGHAYDYDQWAQLGNRGWSWESVLPYFRRSEAFHRPAQAHGNDGEWSVLDPKVRWEALQAYRQAAIDLGIPANEDYNSGDNEGVAWFVATIRKGRRHSTARAFLDPVRNRRNLDIVTGALVDRVIFDGTRATGVKFRLGEREVDVSASAEIILAAGVYGSPAILERSGVGAHETLSALGIETHHELPGVGENLQDHWHIKVQHKLKNTRTLNDHVSSPLRRMMLGASYLATRKGPLGGSPTLLGVFAKTDPHAPAPDIQIHVSGATSSTFGGEPDKFPGITSSVCILRPESRGHSHIASSDPARQPKILHNYLKHESEIEIAIRSVELVRKIAGGAAMARFEPDEITPTQKVQSRDELIAYARESVYTTFHPVGTCKMGRDHMAVVDDRLRVHGLSGLRVADASVMPVIVSGNTQAATVMIAEKASDFIQEEAMEAKAA
ncbi:GMC family oxidoreductase [Aquamicrobium zhengzhouense]|uniref:GMC family oxidoreductase N-terminal domain-containing protein n=1 Tax=Aquamicrobium zhengzhouense TaxID=2781738 RepID=A0ABS0SF35_9HYPH|nr:GMC family oxidoreductase N-terminal domain-containing protein [Aquamicrobium zhengzhouense]MBI1621914.1 GMC family oxidoreductase N-terminal domain-containing protein [Aquamicrobium zhengzhouense]